MLALNCDSKAHRLWAGLGVQLISPIFFPLPACPPLHPLPISIAAPLFRPLAPTLPEVVIGLLPRLLSKSLFPAGVRWSDLLGVLLGGNMLPGVAPIPVEREEPRRSAIAFSVEERDDPLGLGVYPLARSFISLEALLPSRRPISSRR